MGTYPTPAVIGMRGQAGHVLASGTLSAAEHEAAEGYFSVGKFSISVPPNSVAAMALRERLKQDVEIVIRRRELSRVER